MKFKCFALLTMAWCLALVAPLWAAETAAPTYRLGEVVVTASQGGAEAVGTVHTVTASEIKARGAHTLDEALSLVPGLNTRTANAGTPRIDIRGFRTRHVLLLLDGIPINSTFDGQFDPSTFGVENIEKIKVTTGGASVLYGEGGNGGVINIITKKGARGLHGSIGGEAAEKDAYLGNFTLGGANATLDAFVSGSIYDRDGYRLSDDFTPTASEDGGERLNSDRKRRNLFTNLGWTPTADTMLGLSFQYRKDQFGIPPITNYSNSDPFVKKEKYDRVDNLEGYATQLAFDQQLQGPFSTRGWVYFNRLQMLENRYDDASLSTQVANGASRSNSTTDSTGVNFQLKADLQQGVATLALITDNSTWNADGFTVASSSGGGGGGGGGGVTTTSFDLQRDVQVYSAALQYEVQPVKKLGLVFGIGQHFQKRDDHSQDNDFAYELGINYALLPATRLWASHARKVRFPSISQLYDVNSGNSDLSAERTLHYEAGVEQRLPAATSLTLTGYLIDAKDFIEKNDATDRYENFENYRFKGFEVAAENQYVEHLLLRVAYSYLDSEDRSSGSGKDELQYRPRDKFTLEGRYHFPWGMEAYASLLYVGHQYFYDKDNVQKKQLNDYTVVDLKLSQDLLEKQLSLYVGANNLFDKDYEQSYGLPQPGRTLYAGAEYRF